MFRSLPYDGDLVFAEDFVVDNDLSSEVGMGDLYCVFNQLHRRLKSLRISKEEYVLMKSIALLNAGNLTKLCQTVAFCGWRNGKVLTQHLVYTFLRNSMIICHKRQLELAFLSLSLSSCFELAFV